MTSQTAFRAALLDPSGPIPDGLIDSKQQPAGKRYDVYRNNVTVSLIDAMRTAFPLVAKLLGPQNFDSLSALYVRAHPPTSPLMMFYGSGFPTFLQDFAPLKHIGYLPDAATLDLNLRRSYHAADAAPFDASELGKLAPEALAEATITLAPATRILTSGWPLYDIWQFNQNTDAPKPRNVAQDVVITRPLFDPEPHLLPLGAALWLKELDAGAPFGKATDTAQAQHPDFDLTTSLTCAIRTQAFAHLHHKDLK